MFRALGPYYAAFNYQRCTLYRIFATTGVVKTVLATSNYVDRADAASLVFTGRSDFRGMTTGDAQTKL